ncbi:MULTISPECIES: DUF1592 domain-containing protein [Sorangium]|uniref:Uncharacterized protein n=1 Tax=Sorangium cellulosum TaxID=56 RepID=A0A4P2QGV6_SORCE|nr:MULTISPECIES: DUF1592 domain-containing protein [Sorangium]AUX29090.1 hypothetical protein SOCE836_011770 [Sorangium cellulosum]WCQ88481.1 hypothetical protein NQZ70_01158 [Sorangium sp. Soce836]
MKRTMPDGVLPLETLGRSAAPRRRGAALLGAVALATSGALAGCVGDVGGDRDGRDGPPRDSGLVDVASAGMRRMTPEQFTSSMRDLFGDPGLDLDLDPDAGEVASLLAVDKLNAAAEAIVARRASWGTPVFPCDTRGADDEACVDGFVRTFGRRAFRHTLDEAEVAMLKGQFARAREEQSFEDALLVVLKTMIQSPNVYYFVELGRDGDGGDALASGVRPLTGWERASRLSYFLWNTMPDDALLDGAESGALDTAEGVRAQAERLLSHDRARATAKRFFAEWLQLDGSNKHASLENAPKSRELYPEDSPALRAAMRAEVEALAERVLFEGDGRFETLLTTTDAYVNGPLAALYGVEGPAGDGAFAWVSLPADQRAGLFTRAAFLSVFGSVEVKSPIRRGAYILEEVLCRPLGPPPPNASDVPVKGGAVEEGGALVHRTVREDVEAKTSSETCAICHKAINPIGFAFEHYDALGRWQAQETGEDAGALDIDARGRLPAIGPDGESVEVDGGVEMSAALAASAAARACLTRHFFQTALRRIPVDQDLASIEAATPAPESGGSLRDLILDLTTSHAFLHLRKPEG